MWVRLRLLQTEHMSSLSDQKTIGQQLGATYRSTNHGHQHHEY